VIRGRRVQKRGKGDAGGGGTDSKQEEAEGRKGGCAKPGRGGGVRRGEGIRR